jgi:hypothetical protein
MRSGATELTAAGIPSKSEKTHHFIPVIVSIKGRGRCEEGAIILVESHRLNFDEFAVEGPVQGSGVTCQDMQTRVPLQKGPLHVLGFVTSSFPRGVQHSVYPGGLALCQLRHISCLVAGLKKTWSLDIIGRPHTCCLEV